MEVQVGCVSRQFVMITLSGPEVRREVLVGGLTREIITVLDCELFRTKYRDYNAGNLICILVIYREFCVYSK